MLPLTITFFWPDRRIENAENRFSTSLSRVEITQLEETEKVQLSVFVDPDSIELVFVQKTSRKIGMIIEALRNGSQDEVEEQKTFMTFISGALQLIKRIILQRYCRHSMSSYGSR